MTRAALQFLLIGAVLFALDRWALESLRNAPRPSIAISSAQIAELRREALATGRLPDQRELGALVDAAVGDEMLYREAQRLGLGDDDPVVRRRLVQNMRFLREQATTDSPCPSGRPEDEQQSRACAQGPPSPARLAGEGEGEGSDEFSTDATALYRQAVSLGMDRSDSVVRRRLIQRMRLAIEDAARHDEPTEEELQAFFSKTSDRFAEPERVRISHVFLDPVRRRDATDADAGRLLADLTRNATAPEQALPVGDPFLVPAHLPLQSERALAKFFGSDFASAVMELPLNTWSGPLRSSHGLHLAWVHEKTSGGTLPPLAAVRNEVRNALLAKRAERAVEDAVARLHSRYEVQVGTVRIRTVPNSMTKQHDETARSVIRGVSAPPSVAAEAARRLHLLGGKGSQTPSETSRPAP